MYIVLLTWDIQLDQVSRADKYVCHPSAPRIGQKKVQLTHRYCQPPTAHKEHYPLLEHPPTTAHDISHDLPDPGGRGEDEPGAVPWEGYPDPEAEADKGGREEPDALVFRTDPDY